MAERNEGRRLAFKISIVHTPKSFDFKQLKFLLSLSLMLTKDLHMC